MQEVRARVCSADKVHQDRLDDFALEKQDLLRANKRLEERYVQAEDVADRAARDLCALAASPVSSATGALARGRWRAEHGGGGA